MKSRMDFSTLFVLDLFMIPCIKKEIHYKMKFLKAMLKWACSCTSKNLSTDDALGENFLQLTISVLDELILRVYNHATFCSAAARILRGSQHFGACWMTICEILDGILSYWHYNQMQRFGLTYEAPGPRSCHKCQVTVPKLRR